MPVIFLFRSRIFTTFSAALKAAWVKVKIKTGRLNQVAFRKADGSTRTANIGVTPADYEYKGGQQTEHPELVKYWDLDQNAFRSFRLDQLIF